MAAAAKLASLPHRADIAPELKPELRGFIDRCVVPCLVQQFLRERRKRIACESVKVVNPAAQEVTQ